MSAAMDRDRRRRARGQAGMTLIEVLIAMAMLSFMLVMAWSTTSSVSEAQRFFQDVQERNHEIRVAMGTMVRDISSAYLSGHEQSGLDNPRTLFVGKGRSPVDELRFSSLGHRVVWADANESEQTLIVYGAESDPDQPGTTNLIRRELRRLSNEPWESQPADVDVLLRDIQRVEFSYYDWDGDEWQDQWDTTKADAERNRLPERVRIKVTLSSGRDSIERTTQARILMQEQIVFNRGSDR